ncbi:hypothetical protein EI77_01833 [Prosthecobacter fusiformis]|uniref:Uncharacterized protein n=1 Tax=Prosthecobacter fusiformis TaxID=48464 RepID=A0A4V3FG57_9BACT|nr:hypothetical protein EI77_01833 [Prosthecobacter fusiformis]
MGICFPIESPRRPQSPIWGHLGGWLAARGDFKCGKREENFTHYYTMFTDICKPDGSGPGRGRDGIQLGMGFGCDPAFRTGGLCGLRVTTNTGGMG